jgi:hypothetical protein
VVAHLSATNTTASYEPASISAFHLPHHHGLTMSDFIERARIWVASNFVFFCILVVFGIIIIVGLSRSL